MSERSNTSASTWLGSLDGSFDPRTPEPSASVTDWDVVHAAGSGADNALEAVSKRYWPAIYGFLRRSGRSTDEAGDLTQGFLADVLIGGDLLERADPGRGRFRALLFSSLRNYVVERHRHATRQRRAPAGGVRTLDHDDAPEMPESGVGDPDQLFDQEWCRTLVRSVLIATEEACERGGLITHWRIFRLRVVDPLMTGAEPTAYSEIVSRLGLNDESQAANMMITAKRRFARALREEIANTVSDPTQIDDEIRGLLGSLGGNG